MTTSEKALTFLAIFISCLALVVSIVQTNILQKQSKAAVWPRMSIGQSVGSDRYESYVSNDGVGPAIVSSIKYTYKDTSFQEVNKMIHYFGELESIETGKPIGLNFTYSIISEDRVFKPSEKLRDFVAKDSISVLLGKKYFAQSKVEIEYCSIYDSCWLLNEDEKTVEIN